jgi:hypothetical protein
MTIAVAKYSLVTEISRVADRVLPVTFENDGVVVK